MGNRNSSPSNFVSKLGSLVSDKFDEDPINEEAQKIFSELKIDLDEALEYSITSKLNAIKLDSINSQKLPVLININTKNQKLEKKSINYRPPIDLICVIDHSGSMAGKKIEYVRETLKYMLTVLQENDRLCLIIYDDKVNVITGLERVSEKNKTQFNEKIKTINSDGGTKTHQALVKGLEIIKNRTYKNKVTSLFLLSDGQDNLGSVDIQLKASLEQMKINDVFTINTFGYGSDHDPESMRKIAETKDGDFFYIEKVENVDESFVAALGGLISVLGENLKLKIKAVPNSLMTDLRISKTYGIDWVYDENEKSYTYIMNQLIIGVTKEIVVELNIPPSKKIVDDLERNKSIFIGELEVQSIVDKKIVKRVKELNVTIYNNNEEIPEQLKKENEDVLKNYLRANGTEAIVEARKLADQGKYEEGKLIIKKNLEILEEEKYQKDERIKILSDDLKKIENYCNPSQFSGEGKKFMMGQERFHGQQRYANTSNQMYEDVYANSIQKNMLSSLRKKK